MRFLNRFFQSFLAVTVLVASLWFGPSAVAADRVVLKYKIFRGSIAVSELADFASSGKASPMLQLYLKASSQDPDVVRTVLMQKVDVDTQMANRLLDNPVSELLLDQVGQVVHPPNDSDSGEAMQTALLKAAKQDSQVSLIGIIENYPTSKVEVEGEQIIKLNAKISSIRSGAQSLKDKLTDLL
jgi:Alpha/beta hydrolase of unknown function (DUF1400)